ncbi:hypothetical protein CHELA41_21280 [Hyphomicrobiales bacterium]|nr:hypothetical protein CHELA41_21280 [Hyphomicrobiales bacterium]
MERGGARHPRPDAPRWARFVSYRRGAKIRALDGLIDRIALRAADISVGLGGRVIRNPALTGRKCCSDAMARAI